MPDAIRSRQDFEKLVNGYDGAIAYWDHHLGILLEELADLGIAEETAVIVTSDHGECLGENGCYGDHPMANEPSHRVPMVLRWPAVTTRLREEDQHVSGLVYHLDVCPTICELLGLEVPPGWDGQSFAAAVHGQPFFGREHLVFSHDAYTYQRAMRTPEHLYIRTLHPGCFRIEHEQLYAIADDPHMTKGLLGHSASTASASAPGAHQVADRLRGLLDRWRNQHLSLRGPCPDPMEAGRYESPADAFYAPAYERRLRRTGRTTLADDLSERLRAPWVTRGSW